MINEPMTMRADGTRRLSRVLVLLGQGETGNDRQLGQATQYEPVAVAPVEPGMLAGEGAGGKRRMSDPSAN